MTNTKKKKAKASKKSGRARPAEEKESDVKNLRPVRPKIGETADNLKQRSDWFQKRTGKR